jgi:hypothetical protein
VADRGRRFVVGEERAGGIGFIGFLTLKLSQPDHASGSTSAKSTRLSHVECKPHSHLQYRFEVSALHQPQAATEISIHSIEISSTAAVLCAPTFLGQVKLYFWSAVPKLSLAAA